MKNGKSSGRPNKRSKQSGRMQSSHDAPALFLPISFFGALSVWRLLSSPGHSGSGYSQTSQRKPIIRTHLLSEKGSDYMGLVPVVGLEPTRYRYRRILNPLRLPIPSHRQIWIVLYKLFFRNARGRLTDFPAISSPELEELRGKGIPRPPWACSKAPQEPSARRGPRGKRGLAVQALSFETRM